jgi:hypothetical protein
MLLGPPRPTVSPLSCPGGAALVALVAGCEAGGVVVWAGVFEPQAASRITSIVLCMRGV